MRVVPHLMASTAACFLTKERLKRLVHNMMASAAACFLAEERLMRRVPPPDGKRGGLLLDEGRLAGHKHLVANRVMGGQVQQANGGDSAQVGLHPVAQDVHHCAHQLLQRRHALRARSQAPHIVH